MNRNIPISEPILGEREREYLLRALESGWISSKGDFITQFESGFAQYCGRRYGLATSNGTTALHLAMLALDIGPGDEVIVPNLTFAATANAALHAGATPVLADVDVDSWCLSENEIRAKISTRTRAIVVVHLYGNMCPMNPILELANDHNLHVIEDAAEAHGAKYKGRPSGSMGAISCFSFYGNKIITTGEGGMCMTDDEDLRTKMQILRDHGMSKQRRYWHDVVGYNYRMTNIQAAIGCAQLERIDQFLRRRRQIGRYYREELDGVNSLLFQEVPANVESSFWLFGLRSSRKKKIVNALERIGVETRDVFMPLSDMPPYSTPEAFPNSKAISDQGFCLPTTPNLSDEDLAFITQGIRATTA